MYRSTIKFTTIYDLRIYKTIDENYRKIGYMKLFKTVVWKSTTDVMTSAARMNLELGVTRPYKPDQTGMRLVPLDLLPVYCNAMLLLMWFVFNNRKIASSSTYFSLDGLYLKRFSIVSEISLWNI